MATKQTTLLVRAGRWPLLAILVGGYRSMAQVAAVEATAVAAPAMSATAIADEINPRLLRRFQAVGGGAPQTPPPVELVTLGRALFYETRLSRDQKVACNSCHPLDRFGMDGQMTSTGVAGQRGTRNAPTVLNAASHIAQFWDGRAESVEQQATGPILNPLEMAMPSERSVVAVLESIPDYVAMFRRAFPDDPRPISLRHVGEAVGAFERGLVTRSRWDRFVAGESSALTTTERHGLRVFLDVGCMGCHTGPQVGGTMFQKAGAVRPWPNQKDEGRAAITKSPADRLVFKVPTLKNVVNTAPYFHDGSAPTLAVAIAMMGRHQLGVELSEDEVNAIAAWMGSMTGRLDPAYTAQPAMPRSGAGIPPSQ